MDPNIKAVKTPVCICIAIACLGCLCSSAFGQASVTNLGDGANLADIGLAPVTNELVFVGSQEESGVDVAKVFRLSSDRTSLSSETLVGLGAGTEALGISSDGSRAAGFSDSPASIDTEGISWNLNAPASPQSIGFVPGFSANSFARGAWSGGVVGDHGGVSGATTWTEDDGITILEDAGGLSSALDVNDDGSFVVGFSGGFGATSGASYWDGSGVNQLDDPFGIQSTANAVSPNAEHIGGDVVFFDADTFETGSQAAVWSAANGTFELNLLTIEDPDTMMLECLLGQVNDVSLSGFAVGETLDGQGFIWHESFNGVDSEFLGAQIFDDFLFATEGITLDSLSRSVVGVAEDDLGELHFAVNGSAFIVSDVTSPLVSAVPEPAALSLLLSSAVIGFVKRRRVRS